MSAPRVLHVLPHAGGGGETYVDQLEAMEGFRFERFELSERRRPLEAVAGLVRLVRTIPSHDLVHIHGDSAALVCRPVIGRGPTVITLHGSHLLRRSTGAKGRVVRAGIRGALARADATVAVSESELAYARELAPGAAERIELIRNGVPDPDPVDESDRRAIREQLRLEPTSVAALFVGELSERKQPLQFAQAIERAGAANSEIVGLLAGAGPLQPQLERMRGERLRLLGDRRDVKQLLAASDLFVLPSLWEGLSYAVLEAMALGKATLVSDGPGNPDAVGDTGLIFPAGDVSSMAASLSRLAGDAALRRSLGEEAMRRARERFSLTQMREATARVYERALKRAAEG